MKFHRFKRLHKKLQCRKSDDWEAYRKQRSYCVSVGHKSLRSHLKRKCEDGVKKGKGVLEYNTALLI